MKRYLPLLLLLVFACNQLEEEPEFLRMDNIRVTKVTGKEAFLNADAFFYNPNDVNLKLRHIDVAIEVDGKKVGTINQVMKTRIPALSEFKVPLDATFDIRELGLLNGIISILGGKKLDVHYNGFLKVSVHGFPVKVPIDYDDEVRL